MIVFILISFNKAFFKVDGNLSFQQLSFSLKNQRNFTVLLCYNLIFKLISVLVHYLVYIVLYNDTRYLILFLCSLNKGNFRKQLPCHITSVKESIGSKATTFFLSLFGWKRSLLGDKSYCPEL